MVKRAKGVFVKKNVITPKGNTLSFYNMYEGRAGYNMPTRYNTEPYKTQLEKKAGASFHDFETAPPPTNTIVQTPESKGAGSRFMHKRHPAMHPASRNLFDQKS